MLDINAQAIARGIYQQFQTEKSKQYLKSLERHRALLYAFLVDSGIQPYGQLWRETFKYAEKTFPETL
jgi:hypothetical protein